MARPRKPSGLIVRAETKADKQRRVDRERAVRPKRALPVEAPARLKEHDVAAAAWRRLMRLYGELEAEIVTRLDQDMLIDYCLLIEQLADMDQMRKGAQQIWEQLEERRLELLKAGDIEGALEVAIRAAGSMEMIVKMDARVDRKRSLLHQWRQSLYLTPRARAGVNPRGKEAEQLPDELEQLLNDVEDFVNGPAA